MKTIARIMIIGCLVSSACVLAIWLVGGCPPDRMKTGGVEVDIGGGIIVRRTAWGDVYLRHQ